MRINAFLLVAVLHGSSLAATAPGPSIPPHASNPRTLSARQRAVGAHVADQPLLLAPEDDCQRWFVSSPGPPAPVYRDGETPIFDPVRHRLVMFGGYRPDLGFGTDEVWAYDLAGNTGWTQLLPSGTAPFARAGHSAIYDPIGDRMIVFGGTAFHIDRNDTWALDFSPSPAWHQLAPTGVPPSPRNGQTAIYDSARHRMVIFAGNQANNETWALSLGATPAWTKIPATGFPVTQRSGHTAIYDPARDRMIVYGGFPCGDVLPCGDLWQLPFTGSPTWTQMSPVGAMPPGRSSHMAAYDPQRDRMVIYGGGTDSGNPAQPWTLELGVNAWKQMVTANSVPNSTTHTAIFDSIDEGFVWCGGPVYELSFAGGLELSVIASGGGSVSTDPPQRCYASGSTVTLTATPNPSRVFYRWRGSASGNTNPLAFTMTDHAAIVAEFVAPTAAPDVALDFSLANAAPNPTSASTRLDYSLPYAAFVRLVIVDVAGREVAQLLRSLRGPGRHSVTWDGFVQNQRAPAGIYFARLQAGERRAVQRIVLVH